MTVRFYSFEDTGAPVLPNISSQRFIDNLRLILMACLVDGYGDKTGAGWTIGHEHADGFSLSNGEGFINFVSVSAVTVTLYAIEAITDGSTALAEGYNRRSGSWYDGSASANRQRLHSYFVGTQSPKRWCVVADSHTATVIFASGSGLDPTGTFGCAIHFGRFLGPGSAPGFCVLGGIWASYDQGGFLMNPSMRSGCSLRNPFTGLLEQGVDAGYGLGIPVMGTTAASLNSTRPAPAVTRLSTLRAPIIAAGTLMAGSAAPTSHGRSCGLSRGIVCIPELSDIYLARVLPYLGVSSPTEADRYRPITMPNGDQYVPLYPNTGDLGAFISLNPADWE